MPTQFRDNTIYRVIYAHHTHHRRNRVNKKQEEQKIKLTNEHSHLNIYLSILIRSIRKYFRGNVVTQFACCRSLLRIVDGVIVVIHRHLSSFREQERLVVFAVRRSTALRRRSGRIEDLRGKWNARRRMVRRVVQMMRGWFGAAAAGRMVGRSVGSD